MRDRLAYVFKRLNLTLHELHEPLLEPFGISAGELSILLLVSEREPESQQQIAQRLGIDRTTMVALIDALEGKGLVERRADPRDRRRNVIDLTPTGVTTLRQATEASDLAEAQLLAPLSSNDADRLRHLLNTITPAPRGHH